MPTTTTELGLTIATATDNQPTYLTAATASLAESLTLIDGLFNDTTGHTHGGPGEGGPITLAADSVPPTALQNALTQVGIVAPTGAGLPPAGSWRLYPHADGQYYKIDSTGTELPIVAPGAIPDPLTLGTLTVTTSLTAVALAVLPPVTQATQATTPATGLPPVGSRLLYPKADGYYYSVDDTGAELPVSVPGAAAPTPVALTGSVYQIGSTMVEQIIDALVTHGLVDATAVTDITP